MRRAFAFLVTAVGLAVLPAAPSDGGTVGPVCWQLAGPPQPFSNLFSLVFFTDPSNPNVAMVAGKEVSTPLHDPVSGAIFVEDGTALMTLTVAQRSIGAGRPTSFVVAAFSLSNPSGGSARCESLHPSCTSDAFFKWTLLPGPCPEPFAP